MLDIDLVHKINWTFIVMTNFSYDIFDVQVKAQDVWYAVIESQIETGTPYMLYKDSCNRKSNQQNLGPIKCSNLCTEIVEYSSPDEIAVCNLASIAVNQFVKVDGSKPSYDFARLKEVTKVRF